LLAEDSAGEEQVFVSQDFNPGYLQVISGTFALSCVLLNTADDDPEEPPHQFRTKHLLLKLSFVCQI
jgi:hypothetical protein